MLHTHKPNIPKASLESAIALLEIPTKRQQFHSEDYPTTSKEQARASMEAWQSLASVIEPFLRTDLPSYEYEWHPLPSLVVASQWLWHWYEIDDAAPLIEHAVNLAETLRTPEKLTILCSDSLSFRLDEHSLHKAYVDGAFYHLGWYYLAEIAEVHGDMVTAMAYYERFIDREYDFAPFETQTRDKSFYYLHRFVPNTVEACRRAGLCAEACGLFARARQFYDYALRLRHTRFSPLLEKARLLRNEGRPEEAGQYELAYLDTLAACDGTERRQFELFDRYLALAERLASAEQSQLARYCRFRALWVALHSTEVAYLDKPFAPHHQTNWRLEPFMFERLRSEANAAAQQGDQVLALACFEPLFRSSLQDICQADVETMEKPSLWLATIEEYLKRVNQDGSRGMLSSACEDIALGLKQATHIVHREELTRRVREELAALLVLYRKLAGDMDS